MEKHFSQVYKKSSKILPMCWNLTNLSKFYNFVEICQISQNSTKIIFEVCSSVHNVDLMQNQMCWRHRHRVYLLSPIHPFGITAARGKKLAIARPHLQPRLYEKYWSRPFLIWLFSDSRKSNLIFINIIIAVVISMVFLGLMAPVAVLYLETDPLYYICKLNLIDPFMKRFATTYRKKVVFEFYINLFRWFYITIGGVDVVRLITAWIVFSLLIVRSTLFCLLRISEKVSVPNPSPILRCPVRKVNCHSKVLITSRMMAGFTEYQALKISWKMSSYLPEAAILFSISGGSIVFLLAIIVTISFYNRIPFASYIPFPFGIILGFLFSSGGLRQASNCYECSSKVKDSWRNHISYFNSTTLAERKYWTRRYQSLMAVCLSAGISDTIFLFVERSTCSRYYYELINYALCAILSLRETK